MHSTLSLVGPYLTRFIMKGGGALILFAHAYCGTAARLFYPDHLTPRSYLTFLSEFGTHRVILSRGIVRHGPSLCDECLFYCFLGLFSFHLSLNDDTHIVVWISLLGDACSHFVDQLVLLGLSVQLRKCGIWSHSSLPDSLSPLSVSAFRRSTSRFWDALRWACL